MSIVNYDCLTGDLNENMQQLFLFLLGTGSIQNIGKMGHESNLSIVLCRPFLFICLLTNEYTALIVLLLQTKTPIY